MNSNSQIFSSTVFGTSSGKTNQELAEQNTKTIELFFKETALSKFNNRIPQVPSNQNIAKGK